MASCKALAPDEIGAFTLFTFVHAAFGWVAGYISSLQSKPYLFVI